MRYSHRSFAASFKADPELWSRFKEECRFRGVSVCHVLEALMEAWIQGQRATATVIKPVVVNLTMEHVVQRPRRLADVTWVPYKPTWPPSCSQADNFMKSTKDVGCLERRDWISLKDCWRCYQQKHGMGGSL